MLYKTNFLQFKRILNKNIKNKQAMGLKASYKVSDFPDKVHAI
jgi:hypothetical protein